MLRTSPLLYQYDAQKKLEFPALTLVAGDACLLLGQSGSGKTTFLNLLTGLLKPTSGTIFFENQDITALNSAQIDRLRGQKMGIVLQESHFVQSLNIRENMQLSAFLAKKDLDKTYMQHLFDRLGISALLSRSPNRLSVGEQQRASIARAMLLRPKILFADEPTSALDDRNTAEVVDLLQTLCRDEGAALVVVTHDSRLKTHFERHLSL